LAFHDALTGLPNRQLFSDRVNHSLARSRRHGSVLAVLFLDLDNFKVVNDSLGHDIGDQMLVAVAGRLLRCLREEDTAARLGGDEFAILLEDITDMDDASDVAARILTALSDPFVLNGQEVFAAASIGIAISDNTYRSVDELLRDADVAMYGAKRAGRARFAHYEPSMGENALQRLELEIDLRYAIERDELVLHYQPVLNISIDPEGELTGFEALMRWEHPTRGLVAPGDFIPIAEETGLIVELGRWAVERACVQMIEWERTYPDAPWFAISVNISGRQFSDASFVGDVASILAATGVDPFRLIIEITESQMMDDVPSSIRTLRGLRELGVQLAVDDFGTGYSSLSSLRHLPVNHLKIDRSFIETVGTDSDDSIIISGIIGLTHGLGLSAVAEGIETAEQLAKVRDLGCNYAQGFYFSRPLPPGDLTHFLQPVALNRVAD
jgi:diguanylate cyclase (GGDEF)-like protein